ncbi:hypothetical protein OG338_17550 [Streptomyces sp. NBC_00726]|uniref:hypothetical protein n=1 Tax=Streptomyces sp. NBC_00726 TaxID=2903674 RepID=UPI00386FB452
MDADLPAGRQREEDMREESVLRDAMSQAADALPPLPDLVPAALSLGRRRRARARARGAVAGSVFGVVTAVALGLSVLRPWSGREADAPPARPPVSASPTPSAPERAPVHVEPGPGRSFPNARLPKAERARQDTFQQTAAVTLDDVLPASVGTIRPQDNDVRYFRGESAGRAVTVVFSVRSRPEAVPESCVNEPRKHATCEVVALKDGSPAHVRKLPSHAYGATEVSVGFRFGGSDVSLTVSPGSSSAASAPVTPAQLVRAVNDQRLRKLMMYADEHPVLKDGGSSE